MAKSIDIYTHDDDCWNTLNPLIVECGYGGELINIISKKEI